MQISSAINDLAVLGATRRTRAGAPAGSSFASELARTQNLPSSLTGSSGGRPALGMSLDTLLAAQGATGQLTTGPDRSDPLNQPQKPTLDGGTSPPLRSHRPMLSGRPVSGMAGSEGPEPAQTPPVGLGAR